MDTPDPESLGAILGKLDTGMRCVVVHSEEEADRIFVSMADAGYQCAAMSGIGLPKGSVRLTFLPNSKFSPEPEGGWSSTGPVLQDGPPVSRQPTRPVQDWIDDIDAVAVVPYVFEGFTGLPDLLGVELEQLTTLCKGGVEVVYYDIRLVEHYPPSAVSEGARGGVRSRIQTRQRVRDGDIVAARADALRRSVDFAAGRLIANTERDGGNGD